MHPHLATLHDALTTEQDFQQREYERVRALPLDEQVALGMAWSPLNVTHVSEGTKGRTMVRVQVPRGGGLHDGISAGNPVLLAPVGNHKNGVSATCMGADEMHAELRVDGPWEANGQVTVVRGFDVSTFQWYRSGLRRLNDKSSTLREVLLGERVPGVPPDPLPDAKVFSVLNGPQQFAARNALGSAELAMIHGPPGTGKTTVLVALLWALVERGDRPWALADSNAAVDHLAVKAAAAGLNVVRLGHIARIGSAAAPLTLHSRVAASTSGDMLQRLDREIIRARRDETRDGRAALREMFEERSRVWAQARDAILAEAQVVASTMGTLVRKAADLPIRPVTAVVDEATQAIEPAILSVAPWVQRLFLIGDPKQLGPVVKEPNNPLATSLLMRLLNNNTLPMPMLAVQHRMNRQIQALVDPVYDGALSPHKSVADHLLSDLEGVEHSELTDRPVLWIDTAGAGFDEARDPLTSSTFNAGEARVVQLAVNQLIEAGVAPEAIGIATPYSAQVAHLQELLPQGIEVASINAFQGREKEAIICSWVRSNVDGQLGFVADPRRLTVALSRARRLLVCVGDSATLSIDSRFAEVLDALQEQGAWATVWEPPWDGAVE